MIRPLFAPRSTRRPPFPLWHGSLVLAAALCCATTWEPTVAADDLSAARPLLISACHDCHNAEVQEGGLDLASLSLDLSQPAVQATWIRIHDRIASREMPPADATPLSEMDRSRIVEAVSTSLHHAHQTTKGTVLRRLNRTEYANTMNDLFGTHLQLADMLPEDGRSHGFDTVGDALSISAVQMERYLQATETVIDAAVVKTIAPPVSSITRSSYAATRGAENFLGKNWLLRDDGAVVFFRQWGYPTGMLRETNVRQAGRYKVRVHGYAFQSTQPITFSIAGTTFQRGVEQPTFGYFSMPPGDTDQTHTIEIETWIEAGYMIRVEPWGIDDAYQIKNQGIDNYTGPGLAITSIEVEGPLAVEWPSRGHKLLFDGLRRQEVLPRNPADRQKSYYQPRFELQPEDGDADIALALHRVASAAFRRPADQSTVSPYLRLFQAQRDEGLSAEEAYRTAVVAIFCAPDFLFLKEPEKQLDDYQLAARLSYALRRTAPDESLRAAAARSELCRQAGALRHHAQQFLASPEFERFIVDFTDSWLNLREIEFTNPDKTLFPEFDEYLQYSMVDETRSFLREMIRNDMPVVHLVKSDFAMLNERLAQHYEIRDVAGPQIRRVPLDRNSIRGGLLTQGAVLKVSANGNNTSPVVRGVYVMERILAARIPSPPPGIPGVEPDIRGASTLRQLLARHRDADTCRSCHQLIDPPGFALESFDPVGLYRERFRTSGEGEKVSRRIDGNHVQYRLGLPVDAAGELADGRTFADFSQFRDLLAADPQQLAAAFVTHFLTFATGREMGFSDRAEIQRIATATAVTDSGIRSLLLTAIDSEIFRQK